MDAVVLGGTSDLPVLEAPQIKTSLQRILVVEVMMICVIILWICLWQGIISSPVPMAKMRLSL